MIAAGRLATVACLASALLALGAGCTEDPQARADAVLNAPTDVTMRVVSVRPRAGFAGEVLLTDQPAPETIVEVRLATDAPPLGLRAGATVRFYLADPSAAFGPGDLSGVTRRVRITRHEDLREGNRYHLESSPAGS